MQDSTYIKRLKERLRQNPDTKLFLSLAEEMRKRDKMDEAIAILVDGIKRNPDFVAARLTLGRWYLSCNMFSEAKKEFLEVLAKSPQNIHVRERLAEVNKNMGIDKEVVVSRLNRFLEAVKTQFSSKNMDSPQDSDGKDFVKNRLNKFLDAIKSNFASMPVSSI
jgi:predicted Zn-dependent protease